MLSAHLVINTVIPAFEQRPEAFNAVRVDLPLNIFAAAMIDFHMLETLQTDVSCGGISVKRGTFSNVLGDCLVQLLAIERRHYFGLGFAFPARHSEHRCLASSASASVQSL